MGFAPVSTTLNIAELTVSSTLNTWPPVSGPVLRSTDLRSAKAINAETPVIESALLEHSVVIVITIRGGKRSSAQSLSSRRLKEFQVRAEI